MAPLGIRVNVILTKIILTTDGTKICAKKHMVVRECIPQGRTTLTTDVDVNCVPLPMVDEGCSPLWDGSSKVLLRRYIASFMVLVTLCTSLSTMEKLSTLCNDLKCYYGHRWGRGLDGGGVPVTFLESFPQSPC